MSVQELLRPSSMDQNVFQDEMDLLEEPEYQDEIMDAELEPTEEEMLDVASKEDRDALQSEDLDMDESNYEANEVPQDVTIEELEPVENTIVRDVPAVDPVDVHLPNFAGDQISSVDNEAPGLRNGSKETDASFPVETIDAQQQPVTVEMQSKQEASSSAIADRVDERFEMAERITENTSDELQSPQVQAGTSRPQLQQEDNGATIDYTGGDNGQVQSHDRSPPKEMDQHSKADVAAQQESSNERVSRGSAGIETRGEDNHDGSSNVEVAHPITISFQDTEMSLFAPLDADTQSPQTFLLDDRNLASQSFNVLFQACRSLLEGSIEDYCEFEMHFHDLQLSISETHAECANITLIQIVQIYIQLQHNDDNLEPPPMYVELSTKTDLRKQLQYLQESVTQKKGLSECVSQDISDDEEILSPAPSDQEEGPGDDSLPIPLEGQQLNETLENDTQGNGEPANDNYNNGHFGKSNADLVHRTSAVREIEADTKDLGEIKEILGDHDNDGHVPNVSQKGNAPGSTNVTATSVMGDQDSTEHAAIEADSAQSNEPNFDGAPPITEDSIQAEGSSTSSTLQGDILTTEEEILELPETAEDLERWAINDVAGEVELHEVHSGRGELNNDFGEQPVGYSQETSEESTKVQNGNTLPSQELDPLRGEFTDPSILLNEAKEDIKKYENLANEIEADLGGLEQCAEDGQGDEDDQITDSYHDDLLQEEQYGIVDQEPTGGPEGHAEEVSQDHTTAAIDDPLLGEEEEDEINLTEIANTEDVIDQSLPVVNDKDDLTPQTPIATVSPKPESQSPTSLSRKRSRGLEKEDYDSDALEAAPKRVKST